MLVKHLGAWVVCELCAPVGRSHRTKSVKVPRGFSAASRLRVSISFDYRKHNVDSFLIWKISLLYEPECFYLDTRTDHIDQVETRRPLYFLDL
ncbi:hypothetical protein CRYUN_Cryun03dG0107500 [Craigia yunnanensis]